MNMRLSKRRKKGKEKDEEVYEERREEQKGEKEERWNRRGSGEGKIKCGGRRVIGRVIKEEEQQIKRSEEEK